MASALQPVPASGLVLGRFRPLRPLGTGGSGSVWLARDEKSGLEVALKIVAKEGKAAPRAEREANAAARLRHPSCLRAYGMAADERHVYIAYEYVPGTTLRHALRTGTLDDRGAVEAAAQVLEGLAFAHSHGIVHRDVKPSNVLLAEEPEISVRLFDFGLAQLADAETLTASGDVPGTLAYISPERLRGEAAGPPADVWAVGVLLWEALAGRHPFWRASPLEMGRRIEAGAPSLGEARPDLARPLIAAVDRALAVDPRSRPSAAGLAKQLRAEFRERARRPRRRVPLPAGPQVALRLWPAVLAALVAGWTAAGLPFYPQRWPLLLAAVAAGLTGFRARLGLAFALAVPVLPLGNVSLGLALLYAVLAAAWFALAWRNPRGGLLFALGPLLAPLGALPLLPLLLQRVPGFARRAVYALAAVLLAGIAAGVRGEPLPFVGVPAGALGIADSEHPLAVAGAVWRALADAQALGLEALVLGGAAALLPLCLRGGDPGIAAFGAALLAGTLLAAPAAPAVPLVVAGWLACAALAVQSRWAGEGAAGRHTFGTFWSLVLSCRWGNLPVPPNPLHRSAARRSRGTDRRSAPGGGLGWPLRIRQLKRSLG